VFLPAPGDAIWILLATPRTIDELVEELAARYHEGRATIADDVAAFVAQLDRNGLVRR
jgi:Coenzyme PQQ synthesis protein D (PqqD)